ncbi:hypothetical protein HAX54_002151 [Datura stramonium]|uniref:Uncharacterized protein n=1 Tax=Datura stramonium TaxID=4076 RepID=A0ABS8T5S1_DATST|nr:hypothetical protein [Datura stramonium]
MGYERQFSKLKNTMGYGEGVLQIGVYDTFNVFLDFTNEDDFNTVWYRRVIEIKGIKLGHNVMNYRVLERIRENADKEIKKSMDNMEVRNSKEDGCNNTEKDQNEMKADEKANKD